MAAGHSGIPQRAEGQRIGCYPGSFNPPTTAHLAVAEAAVEAGRLDRLDLVLSTVALGKANVGQPSVAERAEVLRSVAATRPWLGVCITEHRLIADIAATYDLVVMGADKWRQVTDPSWYSTNPSGPTPETARDRALASLPAVLVVPRGGDRPEGVSILDIDESHHRVNATEARSGSAHAREWVLPEAAAHAVRTGAWPGLAQ